LSFQHRQKRLPSEAYDSPQSGRTRIAQRFIAGYGSLFEILVREADDRCLKYRPVLSPVSRARDQIFLADPSTEGAGLFSIVRCADFKPNHVFYTAVLTLAVLSILLTSSCASLHSRNSSPKTETREVTDEAGRRVQLGTHIDRIVSTAPNLTEIVYAVGAGDRLVGRTKYCDYPPEAKNVAEIGDTMTPSIERIIALKPQIVLVSTASQLEAFTKQLDQQKIAVYVTDPHSLEEVFRSIATLGDLFGTREQAATLVADLRRRTAIVEAKLHESKPVSVFYQLSGEPLYTIGRESFLTDLIQRAGGTSVTANVSGAFPRYSDEAALAARPEAIILPSGGSMGAANLTPAAPLKNSPAVVNGRVFRINDDHLDRPGPRLVDGLEEMARALHPEAFK
jgi:iron complex transport system substrate-binding protein